MCIKLKPTTHFTKTFLVDHLQHRLTRDGVFSNVSLLHTQDERNIISHWYDARGDGTYLREKVILFCLAPPSATQNNVFPSFLFCHTTYAQGEVDCCLCIPIPFFHRCCTCVFVWHHVFSVCPFIRMS